MDRNLVNVFENLAPVHPTIVLDNGSYMMKAGYAGEDFPRSITPNIVGTTRSERCDIPFQHGSFEATVPVDQRAHSYAGQLAKINQGVLDTVCPMSNGLITDWEAMEQMWSHIFYEELLAPPELFNILHTESLLNSMQCREKLIEIMFESFNLPNTAIVPKSVLPLYSHGKVNGLVVDSGYDYTHVVPVESGYPVANGIRSMPVGGWHVTQYMKKLINERGYDMKTPTDVDYVTKVKEKFGYCSLDFQRQQAHLFTEDMEQKYTLPDGMVLKVNSEAFHGPEIMFNPGLFNIVSYYGGVHDLIYKACSDCRIEEQPNLYRNIVLAGGNTLFPFLSQRLRNILSYVPYDVAIAANPERSYSTWIGGSIIASLSTFDQVWISSGEYKEHGPAIVHKKNYYNL